MKKILLLFTLMFFIYAVIAQSYHYTYTAGASKFVIAIDYNKLPKGAEKKWRVTIFDVYDMAKIMTEETDYPLEIYPYLAATIIKIDKVKMGNVLFTDANRENKLQELFDKLNKDRKDEAAAVKKAAEPENPAPKSAAALAAVVKTDTFSRRFTVDSGYVLYVFKNAGTTQLVICYDAAGKKPDPCYSQTIDDGISQADFKKVFKTVLQKHYAKPQTFDEGLNDKAGEIFTAWKEEKVKREEKEKGDEEKAELKQRLKVKDSLLNALAAEDVDAATIKLMNSVSVSSIPNTLSKEVRKKFRHQKTNIAPDKSDLVIDSVTITTQNNTLNQIDIVGKIDGKEVMVISNLQYGIPLRRIIDGGQFTTFSHQNRTYKIYYSDLFLVRQGNKSGISYTLRDSVYTLLPNDQKNKIVVKRMRFLDFISASAFIDLFSLNNQNTNKNLNTEVNIGFPINHSSIFYRVHGLGAMYHLRQIGMNIWVASDIGDFSNNESGLDSYAHIKTDGAGNKINTNYINNFDLIKHSFLRINPTLNLASLDAKRWGSFLNIDFGVNWFASKIKYVDTLKRNDSLVDRTFFAFSPELNFKWKINPTQNFAADIQIGYLWNLKALTKDVVEVYGGENTRNLSENERTHGWGRVLKFELNFYFNPNISISSTVRGGWYIKTLYYKSLENIKNHFQFMVGYSSDVKRLFRY